MKNNVPKVIVDADACPRKALQIILKITKELAWEMVTVASFKHNVQGSPQHLTVGDKSQSADLAIVNLVQRGDIVVTQDWGLAALILGKGAKALSPWGKIYQKDNMDFLLEERHLKAKVRRAGGRTKGPAARSSEDDQRFAHSLGRLMEEGNEY